MLPFVWVVWTFYYSFQWVKYGGVLTIHSKPEVIETPINIKNLFGLMKDLNTNIHTLIEETK